MSEDEDDRRPEPPRGGFLRFLRGVAIVAGVVALVWVVGRWQIARVGERKLRETVEQIEVAEPDWRFDAIEVRRRDGDTLAGRVRISDSETRWTFQPESGWSGGSYLLRIDAGLEDPSGNVAVGDRAAGGEPLGGAAGTVLPFDVELRPVPSTARR